MKADAEALRIRFAPAATDPMKFAYFADLVVIAMRNVLEVLVDDTEDARSAGLLGVLLGFQTCMVIVAEPEPKVAVEAFLELMHAVPDGERSFEVMFHLVDEWKMTSAWR